MTNICPTAPPSSSSSVLGQAADLLQDVRTAIFGSYRPELHYMRGPGPRYRAKYGPTPLGYASAEGRIT